MTVTVRQIVDYIMQMYEILPVYDQASQFQSFCLFLAFKYHHVKRPKWSGIIQNMSLTWVGLFSTGKLLYWLYIPSLVFMLFYSRSHAQKKELQNIIKIIEEHYLISIGTISFKYCSGQFQSFLGTSFPCQLYHVTMLRIQQRFISFKQLRHIIFAILEQFYPNSGKLEEFLFQSLVYVSELHHVFKGTGSR